MEIANCEEEVSPILPQPKSKIVCKTSMVDANLIHCKVTKNLIRVFCTLSTRNQLIGFHKSKVLCKRPPMELNLRQLALQKNKSSTFSTD